MLDMRRLERIAPLEIVGGDRSDQQDVRDQLGRKLDALAAGDQ